MTPYDQARAWLDKQDAAVSGSGGHGQTFHVITTLAKGFTLSEGDVESLAREYNARCSPPWSDRELSHKLSEAFRIPRDKPEGYMLRQNRPANVPKPFRQHMTAPTAQRPHKALKVEPVAPVELPEPIEDGARALISSAFRAGEGIRIANAALNPEGREVPANEGPCLTREEWLRKLSAPSVKGDPNKIWSSSKRTGIYITINPMRVGGSKDADVTDYRHALIEFDNISPEEQWAIYSASRLPCAAVISSGGKSIHAWVRVDARDREEYAERVRILYDHFAGSKYDLDTKNKNPSRFSRLPNCVRFAKRQELLALNIGAESFTEWLKEQANADLKACLTIPQLDDMDTKHDPGCVLGFRDGETLRYLCKGKSAWLIGPSGIGKSSLLAQLAIGWGKGCPVFGIATARPLKSLIVQAENDDMDLAEMVKGVVRAHEFVDEIPADVARNVLFYTETTSVGEEFVRKLHRLIDRERPDIVWCDPLLSFAGIRVTDQDQVTFFLRQLLQPVLEATGVVLIGLHHTGKPKFAKDVATWTALDFAYSGIGSSELVNWARAVMVLHPHGDGVFELKLAKRGGRAGATNPDGSCAYSQVWMRHSRTGILWEHIEPPAAPEPTPRRAAKQPKEPKPPKLSKEEALIQVLTSGPAPTPWEKFAAKSPAEGESAREFGIRFQVATVNLGHGLKIGGDAARKVWPALLESKNLLRKDSKTDLWHPTNGKA